MRRCEFYDSHPSTGDVWRLLAVTSLPHTRCNELGSMAWKLSGVYWEAVRITGRGARWPMLSFALRRPEGQFDFAALKSFFANKRVLVTGAAGSVGSALCMKL